EGAIMDVVQKVRDLSNLAFDDHTSTNERLQAAVAALRLVERYLLGKKKVNVAAEIIDKITNPAFVEVVVSRVEKFAEGFDRALGSVKKVSDRLSQNGGDGAPRRARGSKRRYR